MFGEWLRQRMAEQQLTQYELGRILGVRQQSVSRWLKSIDRPGGQRLGKLATALGVEVTEIIAELERDDEGVTLRTGPRRDDALERQVRELSERLARLEAEVRKANERRS